MSGPNAKKTIFRTLSWLVSLLVTVFIVLSGVRLLFFPVFLEMEYRMPGFPADPYGFSLQERLYWSKIALEYLLNDAGIEFLGDLHFADGTPVYNMRELRHMVDVKIAVKNTLSVWTISFGMLLLLGLWAWRGSWITEYRAGLRRGGWLTAAVVGTIIVFVVLAFGVFFVAFHNVFFAPGTWMFEWSDTLIRLFPERFWRDIFIYVGSFSALVGIALGWGLRVKK